MKSELRMQQHRVLRGAAAVEVWYEGRRIAAVYGADGPGVRIVSKYPASVDFDNSSTPGVTEIQLGVER